MKRSVRACPSRCSPPLFLSNAVQSLFQFLCLSRLYPDLLPKRDRQGFGSSSISSCEFRVNRFKSNVISSKLNASAFTDTFSWNESLASTVGIL